MKARLGATRLSPLVSLTVFGVRCNQQRGVSRRALILNCQFSKYVCTKSNFEYVMMRCWCKINTQDRNRDFFIDSTSLSGMLKAIYNSNPSMSNFNPIYFSLQVTRSAVSYDFPWLVNVINRWTFHHFKCCLTCSSLPYKIACISCVWFSGLCPFDERPVLGDLIQLWQHKSTIAVCAISDHIQSIRLGPLRREKIIKAIQGWSRGSSGVKRMRPLSRL